MVDHDRLFKELITTFFAEFMALFFPEAHRCLDYAYLEFLPQEVFTDVTAGEKNIVDILVKTRLQGEEGHILIHVEPQEYREQEFNRRMFKYFARLHEKHGEKVLPIAVFAYDSKRAEPDTYQVTFPFFFVLQFKFLQVHLKRLSWKDYLRHPNPVAAALLSKMDYSQEEKVRVKVEFLKMLVRLKLDPARMQLLAGFFDSYLVLTREEEAQVQAQLAEELPLEEVAQMTEILTSWHKRGMEEGRMEETRVAILEYVESRFGVHPEGLEMALETASDLEQLKRLRREIFKAASLEDCLALIAKFTNGNEKK